MTAMPRWAWLAMFAIGCGQPSTPRSPRPTPGQAQLADAGVDASVALADDLPRLALRARQMYLDWNAAFSDPDLDCATAAARMNALADKNADVIAANQEVLRGPRERVKALRVELEKYEAEMGPAAKAIIESPVMDRCAGDATFARAVDRIGGEG